MIQPADHYLLSQIVQRADDAAAGARAADTVRTGFPSVDRLLGGGMRRGDLVVLGGDVGAGKSALALAIALRAADAGHGSAFLSGEMGPERVLERALAIAGRVAVDDLRRGAMDDAARAGLGAAAHRLREQLPFVGRIGTAGARALDQEVRALLDVELVVVDSLAALTAGEAPHDEELASAVRRLKGLAVECGVCVLLTAPLAADVRARADHRPLLSDFGALGAVRHHADVVLALYREEQYAPGFGTEGGAELIVLKNRNGATSYADLYFHKAWLRFEDMLDPVE
jgi:replicative DNA helicase